MLRGFLSGIFWGGVLIVAVMGFVSLLAPLPATVAPQLSTAETSAGSGEEGSGDIGEVSQTDEAVDESDSPAVSAPGTEDAAPLADTQSAPQPNPEASETSMNAPSAEEAPEGVSSQTDAPVGTSTPTPDAPEAPEMSPEVSQEVPQGSITNNPEQPMPPAVTEEGAFGEPDSASTDPVKTPESADVSPQAESQEEQKKTESLLKPTKDLTQKVDQHSSSRLPTVGTQAETAETDSAQAPVQNEAPFVRNAVPYDAAEGKPLMAIVLMDDGAPEIDPEALQNFPYPLSIAIGTLVPDVAERVKMYQGMGFEVMAMVDLPGAASPADVEVALDAHLSVMPEAVAIMEGTGDGLQGSKALSDQVTAVLKDSGHGLLLFPKGLNTAQKLASREGVPAASAFRDFDQKGQNANVIRRFLDQAAFKADQEGGVVMVGRLREETLSALLVWGLQDRAGSVALAPVSTVIAAKQP
ncbi:Uncharacterized conserved protein YibQ, putative polysaccharide deacetylase 2 family [Shimia gijangensis]|uniref:Uncharacterized conserved protein YibQ, putative polysaccharide deacetylase 2 family n=1 Tax=Shimia gijangensis TaxID=1470563 RepID=A0A1M6ETH0_9RHOB|nr:divergent polysaccharide deacetylase family protein [Shimia gijangensis]SHI88660.1 Uncharacterized conserved protein YibQ, putative polysaccharide deacetylase 2 family [Shimia gijangensis]